MISDTISECTTTDWLTDRLIDWCCVFCRRTEKQQETVVWCTCSSTGLSQDVYPDFDQTGQAEQGPSPPSMVHPGSDAANETTHATEHPSLPCWAATGWQHPQPDVLNTHRHVTRGSEAVKCLTDDRSQKSVCHWHRDAATNRVSQLDQSGMLYTVGRGSVQKPTLVGCRTGHLWKHRWWSTAN